LKQCREHHTQQVIDALRPCCSEIRAVDAGQEQMIMKLVCLVAKDQQPRFEEGIQAAARKFDDRYSFKYSGPWAPFDFVDISLNLCS
jgi:molybdopterin-guanine dinucleotide biosynthesis protein A